MTIAGSRQGPVTTDHPMSAISPLALCQQTDNHA